MLGVAGVTVIEVMTAEVTVRVVDPETAPETAVMVVVPAVTAFARPWVGVLVLTLATAGFEELHVALAVRFCVLPSL
jgi:hypothetical protein